MIHKGDWVKGDLPSNVIEGFCSDGNLPIAQHFCRPTGYVNIILIEILKGVYECKNKADLLSMLFHSVLWDVNYVDGDNN